MDQVLFYSAPKVLWNEVSIQFILVILGYFPAGFSQNEAARNLCL